VLADLDRTSGALTVRGKGGKVRLACAVDSVERALAARLDVRGGQPGPLFCPSTGRARSTSAG
jgi:hypothetical protein